MALPPLVPILASLQRHRLTTTLLILQVALTCAIVANAIFMVGERIARVSTPSGLPEQELSLIRVRGLQQGVEGFAQQDTDLAALRAIPGVRTAVAVGFTLPLGNGANDIGGCASLQAIDAAIAVRSMEDRSDCAVSTRYVGSPGFAEAMGLRIIAGRDFEPGELIASSNEVILISRALAERLWPGKQAVGQRLYGGGTNNAPTVIGVIENVLRPRLRGPAEDYLVVLSSSRPQGLETQYLLRSAPEDRQHILEQAQLVLAKSGPLRLIPQDQVRTFSQLRQTYFQRDTTMIGLLAASSLALLFVTALGIGGLANFWVGQRTRQIGIRRSLGATRGDILRHFQCENLLVVGAGVALGMTLAYGLNLWLMQHQSVARLPLAYLPVGALCLLALGQLAVLGPALRASRVPPTVATRAL